MTRFDYEEIRFVTLGLLNGVVVAIAHLETADVIRILSVRKASRHEEEIYFKEIAE
ncbi:MAG TPA: BrnT family toxin [Pyrinomonadaceae bacterium]|nr:BrnT family toxin [Pyrinomonadaceae bacterium]